MTVRVVLLSGGSGTRLWPLSNGARSKQFLKVLRDPEGNPESMVQRTLRMLGASGAGVSVTVAASEAQRDSIERQLPDGGFALVLEPERRDTAPAIMLACAHLAFEQGADAGDPVVVMPIDAYADASYYDRVVDLAAAARSGAADLVLLGVAPAYPSAKYGYIVPAPRGFAGARACASAQPDGAGARMVAPSAAGRALPVARFVEKPRETEAAALIGEGALWNCGVFAFRLDHMMGVIARYGDFGSFADVRARYGELPKNSFDYEVVERAENVAVVPFDGEWKDLGTWNTLTEEMAEPVSGRVAVDEATCGGVHVVNETGLPVVVAGLRDAAVVATHDGVLVTSKDASSSPAMKGLIAQVAEQRPMHEHRRWGEYSVLGTGDIGDGQSVLVKSIALEPGGQFSYQRHLHRSEVWIVVSGEGEAVVDGAVVPLSAGSVVNVPVGTMHACRAVTVLRLVEVQVGGPLVEEDIERFGEWWA